MFMVALFTRGKKLEIMQISIKRGIEQQIVAYLHNKQQIKGTNCYVMLQGRNVQKYQCTDQQKISTKKRLCDSIYANV